MCCPNRCLPYVCKNAPRCSCLLFVSDITAKTGGFRWSNTILCSGLETVFPRLSLCHTPSSVQELDYSRIVALLHLSLRPPTDSVLPFSISPSWGCQHTYFTLTQPLYPSCTSLSSVPHSLHQALLHYSPSISLSLTPSLSLRRHERCTLLWHWSCIH